MALRTEEDREQRRLDQPMPKATLGGKLEEAERKKNLMEPFRVPNTTNQYECGVCDVFCNGASKMLNHTKTNKHLKRSRPNP